MAEPSDGTIRLEPLALRHLEGIAELGRDPDVQRFTFVPSPWEEGFERTWLERYEQGHRDDTRAGFAIVDEENDEFLGMAMFVRIDREGSEAEAGYVVSPQARGRGIAARAVRLLTEWGMAELGLQRVELRIDRDNLRSIRVAERAGFVLEGVLRSVSFKQGLRTDMAVYSRIVRDAE
jgi:RimJ/RimL family protein N-acetyltransferase